MIEFTRTDEPVDAQNANIEAGAVFECEQKGCSRPLYRRVVEIDDGTVHYEVGFSDEIRTQSLENFAAVVREAEFGYQRVDADADETETVDAADLDADELNADALIGAAFVEDGVVVGDVVNVEAIDSHVYGETVRIRTYDHDLGEICTSTLDNVLERTGDDGLTVRVSADALEREICTDGGADVDENGETRLLSTHDVRGELRDRGIRGPTITDALVGRGHDADYVVKIGTHSADEADAIDDAVAESDVLEWYSTGWEHHDPATYQTRYVVGEIDV